MMKSRVAVVVATAALALSAVAQESTFNALPGQAEGSSVDSAEVREGTTPAPLRHTFIMCYYVEPTVKEGETARIAYYVTDFDHSKVRFNDDSKRFDVLLQWSSDRKTWEKLVRKGVKSGDGVFELPDLPRGDYVFRLLCRDRNGVPSRTVWNEFRVRTADELTIKPSETVRPSVADLKKVGVEVEPDDFYCLRQVDIGDIEPECNIYDQIRYNAKKMAAEKKALHDSIAAKVTAAIESEEGRRLVAAHPDGYVVFAPAKNGHFIYRTKDWRKVVPGARHDAAALEAKAAANSKALTKYFADLTAHGVRKVVMPKATVRLSANEYLLIPSRLTLDLNGGKLKMNASSAQHAKPIQMFRSQDAHLVNGILEGQYFEYDYETCGTPNPEHVGFFVMLGDARHCSLENLDVRYTVSSGTSFGLTWLIDPFAKPKFDVREWLTRNSLVGFAAVKPTKKGNKEIPGDSWEPGRLTQSGTVRDAGEGCFTSPFRDLDGLTNETFLTVSRFLGYRGMSGVSDYFSIGFYNSDRKYLSGEVGFQYHKILIPAGARYARISILVDSLEKANACDLKMFMPDAPQDCTWRNVRYLHGRTQGLSIVDGFNMLFEDIDISRCGDESCRCASDAEDGWDGMQNMTFRRVTCHDNPNGDFTVCCGHSFVYENCSMRFSVNQRVHSALFRDCTVKGGVWDCLTLTRDGYKRFENNVYDCKSICIGTPKASVERKKVKTDWELVLADGVFRGKSLDEPMKVEVGLTGRYRNCRFENCELTGPTNHFTACTFTNCSTSKKK